MYFLKKFGKYYSIHFPFYIIPFHFIIGLNKTFRQTYEFLKKCEGWSLEQIRNWQYLKIKAVLNNSYQYVPYYKKLFDQVGFCPEDFKDLSDLESIPFLTKNDIKNNFKDMINTKTNPYMLHEAHTGGSTGTPLKFLLDSNKIYAEKAYFFYIWEKYGYKIGDKCIFLKGDKIADVKNLRFERFDSIYNYMRYDSDYLNQLKYFPYYDKTIKEFKAEVLFGFPSSVYQLAKMYCLSGITPPKFRLILLASENTYDDQLTFIRNVFSAESIFYHYGHSEYVVLAFKYRKNSELGFVPQYGYCELINEKGYPISKAGEFGEIVGTSYSYGMPFIRYRTEDFALGSNFVSNDYMKNYKSVHHIEGRLQEFIVSKDKRLISICTMGAAHFNELDKVKEIQYYQEKEGELIFRIVEIEKHHLSMIDLKNIKQALEEKLEKTVNVKIEIVDEVEKTPSNKKMMIRQKLDISDYLKV